MKRLIVQASVFMLLAGSSQSVTLITSGDWFTAGNWDTGVPTGADVASISNNLEATAGSPGGVAQSVLLNGSLTVNAGGSLAVSAATVVGNAASQWGNGTLNISGGNYSSAGLTISQQNASKGVVNITGGSYTNTGATTIGKGRNITQAELNVSGGIYYAGVNNVTFGGDTLTTSKLNVSGGQFTCGNLWVSASLASNYNYYVDISAGSFNSTAWTLTGAGVGSLSITGSNAVIGVSGNLSFGTNLTFTAIPGTNGLSQISVGGNVTLTQTKLVLNPPASAQSFPSSIVLIKAQGTLSGQFGSVTGFGDELVGDIVYIPGPGGEVRIDNLRRPSSTATLYFYSSY